MRMVKAIAEFLQNILAWKLCSIRGFPSHPSHEIAKRTMQGFGGLVTFLVKDADWRQTADVVDRG